MIPSLLLLALPALAQAEPDAADAAVAAGTEAWEVDADRAPWVDLRFDTEEGTWISVDVSPDGKNLVFDLLGHLYEMSIEGGEALAITEGRSWNAFPRYDPSGDRILFTSDRGGSNDLWTLDRRDGAFQNVSRMDWPVFQGTWSRDGRHVYGTALNQQVRFPVLQFNFHGTRQELVPAGERDPVVHLEEHPSDGKIYFERNRRPFHTVGARIETYDTGTGEISTYLARPGGACNPALSPDGTRLVYVHRDDLETVLVLHELGTREERVLVRGLDPGRFESRLFYGIYPNMAWHPDGTRLYVSFGGKIRAVDVATGEARVVPFQARVRRRVDETHRVPAELPSGTTRTRSHRWGVPVAGGAVYEALGDLHRLGPGGRENLTRSPGHETNPIVDLERGRLVHATWSDDELGAVWSRPLEGGEPTRLSQRPAQYGSLALSPDGSRLAWLRGAGDLATGTRLEDQTAFELVLRLEDGTERVVTDVAWSDNRYARRPPALRIVPARADDAHRGDWILFSEFVDDRLVLKRVRDDGLGEQALITFPHATRAVVSPDLAWVAFREYHRTWITPYDFLGKHLEISAADGKGACLRVDALDGDFTEWSPDGSGLYWTRGRFLFEKDLAAVLAGSEEVRRTDLSFEYDLAVPDSTVALTGARVLTMDAEDRVLERATVLVRGDRIVAVGEDLEVPAGAHVLDLSGCTLTPGWIDCHGHYGSRISALNVIEQRPWGLHANLAYGVTTMVDVYGTTQKDFWLSDMLRAGRVDGPRLLSVGDPIFVTKYRTKMHRPIASAADALEHARFNADHGALALKDYSNHTRAARQQLVAACRELGLNLVTESFGDPQMNLTQLVDGFTGIEHTMGLAPLYDDVVRLFGATRVGMTPTLIVLYNGPAGERWFHQRERLWEDEKLLLFYGRDELLTHRRPTHHFDDDWVHVAVGPELRKLADAGVLLQMGAHGQRMGLGAHWEVELFVQGGFTPLEALRIASLNGALHHGLERDLGSLETGKLADLVVLEENPLEDVRNTRAIRYVMRGGVLHAGRDAARVHPDPRPARPMYFKRNRR